MIPYNANVDSLQAAVDVLKGYDAFRILLVGDMKELGEDSLKCHQQVGEHAKQAKLDLVFLMEQKVRSFLRLFWENILQIKLN